MITNNISNLQSELEDIAQSISILAYAMLDEKSAKAAYTKRHDIATLLFMISNYLQRLNADLDEIEMR